MQVILTEAEEAAASWLEWDDAAIGQAVRACAHIAIGEEPNRILQRRSAALLLCAGSREIGARTTTITLNGVTFSGEPIGHYRVTIEHSDEPFLADRTPVAVYDGDKLTHFACTIEGDKVAVPMLRAE